MAGSTPIYGFPYPQSTDLVADYPTLGQELATDVETVISGLGSGLNLITPTSIANSGGTATASGGAVTANGVSTVSLNGVFTSTYDSYMVRITNALGSTSNDIGMRMRAAGTDNSSAGNYKYARTYYYTVGAGSGADTNQSSTQWLLTGSASSIPSIVTINVGNPASASIATNMQSAAGGNYLYSVGGHMSVTTAYDGFTLYTLTGTFSAVIRVYGLKN